MNMNTANLIKMTFGVVIATAATFIVNSHEMPVLDEVKQSVSSQQQDFSQLLSKFDTDKNGALSEAELSTSDSAALKIAFKNLDSNQDANITADEFNTYSSIKLD